MTWKAQTSSVALAPHKRRPPKSLHLLYEGRVPPQIQNPHALEYPRRQHRRVESAHNEHQYAV